jgi:hypothetical protein
MDAAPMSDEKQLIEILQASPRLIHVLHIARDLNLPDWMIFSGAIYQTVWNAITRRDIDYGIKDYDLAYFDPDTSWKAEDDVIQWVRDTFTAPLDEMVEVRNQARVHLWFEDRFGERYEPLGRTQDALTRFVSPAFAVGARLKDDGDITIIAPFGLRDIFDMTIRPNPFRPQAKGFANAAASAKARWPEVKVVD